MKKNSSANRTKKGNVTAKARQEYGDKDGRFPIFDKKSASAAIKLRGHAKTESERKRVIERAEKYTPGLAKKARSADKAKKR